MGGIDLLNKLKKYWVWAIVFAPFMIMLFLHIGVAIGEYTGVNLNVKGIEAKDWFMFAASYLGGAITLSGVVLTLKHERKLHLHQMNIDQINKEKEILTSAIVELDLHFPAIVYEHFRELSTKDGVYNGVEIAELQRRISEKQRLLNQWRVIITINTEIYADMSMKCSKCKMKCNFADTCKEFREKYENISKNLYDIMSLLSEHINQCENNGFKNNIILQHKKANSEQINSGEKPQYSDEDIKLIENSRVNLKKNIYIIRDNLKKIGEFNKKEIPELIGLVRSYYIIRMNNAELLCFGNEKGKYN